MGEQKSEFRNDSKGLVGYAWYDQDNKLQGGVVASGDTVWLSEREEIATANAPKKTEDNPFTNGMLTLVTKAEDVAFRRPIGSHGEPVPEPEAPEAPAEPEEAPEAEAATDVPSSPPAQEKADVRPERAKEEKGDERAAKKPSAKIAEEVATPQAEETATKRAPAEGKRAAKEEVATPTPQAG